MHRAPGYSQGTQTVSYTHLDVYKRQLEEKVNKHNNLIDRVYRLEEKAKLEGERIKVANHRIDDLEDLNK